MKKQNSFFNCKGHNWRYMYFVIIGMFLGSFLASVVGATGIGFDVNNPSSFPNSYSDGGGNVEHKLLEIVYNVSITGIITEAYWYINPNWANLSWYTLYINGNNVSHPNGWTQPYGINTPIRMSWSNLSINVAGSVVVFEMVVDANTIPAGMNIALNSSDVDLDGDIYCQLLDGSNYTDCDGIMNISKRYSYWNLHEFGYGFNYTGYNTTKAVYTLGVMNNTTSGYYDFSGYYVNASDTNNYQMCLQISQNSDLSNNITFVGATRYQSGTFNITCDLSNYEGLYYFRIIGINMINSTILYGNILSYEFTNSTDYNIVTFRFYDEKTGYPLMYYSNNYVGVESSPQYNAGFIRANILIDGNIVEIISGGSGNYNMSCHSDFTNGLNNIMIYSTGGDIAKGQVERVDVSWQTNYSYEINDGDTVEIYLNRIGDPSKGQWNNNTEIYYDDLYGVASWIEFVGVEQEDYYKIGDHPYIVYNLSSSDIISGNYGLYYKIFKDGTIVHQDYISMNGADLREIIEVVSYHFETGTYVIRLYSYNETTLLPVSVIYTSHSLIIKNPSPDSQTPEDVGYGETGTIIGILISFGIATGILLVTHEAFTFPISAGVMIFIFSQKSMGLYNLLDPTIGTSLIVFVAIIAVIMWIFR